jgi:hypothetical protein
MYCHIIDALSEVTLEIGVALASLAIAMCQFRNNAVGIVAFSQEQTCGEKQHMGRLLSERNNRLARFWTTHESSSFHPAAL